MSLELFSLTPMLPFSFVTVGPVISPIPLGLAPIPSGWNSAFRSFITERIRLVFSILDTLIIKALGTITWVHIFYTNTYLRARFQDILRL